MLVRALLVDTHKTAISGDVCRQNSCEPSLHVPFGHALAKSRKDRSLGPTDTGCLSMQKCPLWVKSGHHDMSSVTPHSVGAERGPYHRGQRRLTSRASIPLRQPSLSARRDWCISIRLLTVS